uniref:Uncharacterized protein n=1 Tax=Anguilla anguilla TaxID=7936 RepID=A0A0E9W7I9_ANGAN
MHGCFYKVLWTAKSANSVTSATCALNSGRIVFPNVSKS